MKNNTMQPIKKNRTIKQNPELLQPFAIIKPKRKTDSINPHDIAYLLQTQTPEQRKKYWSKTSMIILFFVILIIYLYHFA